MRGVDREYTEVRNERLMGMSMKNPFTEEQIHEVVRQSLSGILGIEPHEVAPDAALVTELGAESLDLVEFRYEIENVLRVVLPKRSVIEHLADELGSSERIYDQDGKITQFAAEVLRRSAFRYGDDVVSGMWPHEVAALSTSANWAAFARSLFDDLPETCPDCGGDAARVAAAGHAECAGCGAEIEPRTGDEAIAAGVRLALDDMEHPVG